MILGTFSDGMPTYDRPHMNKVNYSFHFILVRQARDVTVPKWRHKSYVQATCDVTRVPQWRHEFSVQTICDVTSIKIASCLLSTTALWRHECQDDVTYVTCRTKMKIHSCRYLICFSLIKFIFTRICHDSVVKHCNPAAKIWAKLWTIWKIMNS